MCLYLPTGMRLKSFGSTTRGHKASIKIELEADDFDDLGYVLSRLSEIDARQKAEAARAATARRRKSAPLLLPAPGDQP